MSQTVLPTPNLSLTVTPPGGSPVNLTQYLAWAGHSQQMMISQQFGRQGDTANLTLVDAHPEGSLSFVIHPLSTVNLVDAALGRSLFSGVVHDPQFLYVSPTEAQWNLNCTDNTFYADNAIVQGSYVGQPMDQIIVDLTAQADCGITAATVADGGYVNPGPVIPLCNIPFQQLSKAWSTACRLGSQVASYGWWVDENRQLHVINQYQGTPSGVTFTTNVVTSGSSTEAHIENSPMQFAYEWDGASLRTRCLVRGTTLVERPNPSKDPAVDTWLGNGWQSAWPLRYNLSTTGTVTVTLIVGGVAQTVLVDTGTGQTAPYLLRQAVNGQWFLVVDTAPVPAAGMALEIWYDYQLPVVAQADDRAAQAEYTGPNGGVFTTFLSDPSLTTVQAALWRASREIQEYATVEERASFVTTPDWVGHVRAGDMVTFTHYAVPDSQNNWTMGVTATMLIVSEQILFTPGGYRTYRITAVRV